MNPKKIKINNLAVNEKIKLLKRKYFMAQDLVRSETEIKKVLEIISNKSEENKILIELLTINSIISYSRCFKSSFSGKLMDTIFDNIHDSSAVNVVSEREFHNIIIRYRDKHIAHTDDFLSSIEIGIIINDTEVHFPILSAKRIPIEDISFYQGFLRLIDKTSKHLEIAISLLKSDLEAHYRANHIAIVDEVLQIKPIPDDKTARQIWKVDK